MTVSFRIALLVLSPHGWLTHKKRCEAVPSAARCQALCAGVALDKFCILSFAVECRL